MAERVLSEDEIQARLPLWCALSDLFLDTEMQDYHYQAIGLAARAGGFSADQVRNILEREVFPALVFNLMSVAGEWAGFQSEFVRERILETLARPPLKRFLSGGLGTGGLKKRVMAEDWPRVRAAIERS